MRLVIDLQGAQGESRSRGIGRYTRNLTDAILKANHSHDVFIVLNGSMFESVPEIIQLFSGSLPPENIRIWHPITASSRHEKLIAQELRISFIEALNPDVVLITSLFEGFSSPASVSIEAGRPYKQAVVLYDLIPLVRPESYLTDSAMREWYLQKVDELQKADLLLAISLASENEAAELLETVAGKIVNISSAVDEKFLPVALPYDQTASLRRKYGISRSFILYTGGIDPRKNVEGLMQAFAQLPKEVKVTYQLVIVCNVDSLTRERLSQLQLKLKLSPGDVLFTGFVDDEDLVKLYNLADLFVFPSLHEGFGLPVLEAMKCGTATIASNVSSLPEILGHPRALFNPTNPKEIARAIYEVLHDESFRKELEGHAIIQSAKFAWSITGSRALQAIERMVEPDYTRHSNPTDAGLQTATLKKKRLAFFSPMPPAKSGIAEYSNLLVDALTEHYSITIFSNIDEQTVSSTSSNLSIRPIKDFQHEAANFDRIVYQMGNSEFHLNFESLNEKFPGVVVMHDFFLSGLHYFENSVHGLGRPWPLELFQSHGFEAAIQLEASNNNVELVKRYPTNLQILQRARAVIVHNLTPLRMAEEWYGAFGAASWTEIPMVRKIPQPQSIPTIASSGPGQLCSFGYAADLKYSKEIVSALAKSEVFLSGDFEFAFVGEATGGFGLELEKLIKELGLSKKVRVTGWLSQGRYEEYLNSAVLAIQLRRGSKGESSAAVLDALGAGVLTICSNSGTMKELPRDIVFKVNDPLDLVELSSLIDSILEGNREAEAMRSKAIEFVRTRHSPENCAALYRDAIEMAYRQPKVPIDKFSKLAVEFELSTLQVNELARALARNFPPSPRRKQVLIDVSTFMVDNAPLTGHLGTIFSAYFSTRRSWALEPIWYDEAREGFFYARIWLAQALKIPTSFIEDGVAEAFQGDLYFNPLQPLSQSPFGLSALERQGVRAISAVELDELLAGPANSPI